MSKGVNKVILIGNCCNDPQMKETQKGIPIVNISLATSEQWKNKNTGAPEERTEFHRVVFFNRLAEIVGKYVRKGSKLYIEGSLRTRQWEQDGVKRYSTEIVASEMQMLDSRGNAPQQDVQHPQGKVSQEFQQPGQQPGGFDSDFDDDIPF